MARLYVYHLNKKGFVSPKAAPGDRSTIRATSISAARDAVAAIYRVRPDGSFGDRLPTEFPNRHLGTKRITANAKIEVQELQGDETPLLREVLEREAATLHGADTPAAPTTLRIGALTLQIPAGALVNLSSEGEITITLGHTAPAVVVPLRRTVTDEEFDACMEKV